MENITKLDLIEWKSSLMTGEDLKAICEKNNWKNKHIKFLAGTTAAAVSVWKNNRRPVPRMLSIVLLAMDEGLITEEWLIRKIQERAH
jgi:hypothetical protein